MLVQLRLSSKSSCFVLANVESRAISIPPRSAFLTTGPKEHVPTMVAASVTIRISGMICTSFVFSRNTACLLYTVLLTHCAFDLNRVRLLVVISLQCSQHRILARKKQASAPKILLTTSQSCSTRRRKFSHPCAILILRRILVLFLCVLFLSGGCGGFGGGGQYHVSSAFLQRCSTVALIPANALSDVTFYRM